MGGCLSYFFQLQTVPGLPCFETAMLQYQPSLPSPLCTSCYSINMPVTKFRISSKILNDLTIKPLTVYICKDPFSFFKVRVFPSNPGSPGTCYMEHTGLELTPVSVSQVCTARPHRSCVNSYIAKFHTVTCVRRTLMSLVRLVLLSSEAPFSMPGSIQPTPATGDGYPFVVNLRSTVHN